MPTAQCPHCGAEYDVGGIATICTKCLKPLPRAEGGPPRLGRPAPAELSPIAPDTTAGGVMPPERDVAPAAPHPVGVTPAALRRPCIKCGEPLYTTEMTCWKCGAQQAGAAVIPPSAAVAPGPTYAPPSPGYPPPPPSPYVYTGSTYPSGASPEAMNRANLSLILGVIGLATLLCCWAVPGVVLGPIAIWLGTSARREGAEGTATAGIVCGIIATILGLVGTAAFIIMIAAGMFAGGVPGTSPTP